MIIDFHTHIFPDALAPKAIPLLETAGKINAHTNGTKSALSQMMKQVKVNYSVILPVATKKEQTKTINDFAVQINKQTKKTKLISFGCIHPDYVQYEEELNRLKDSGIKGIKLHPEYQNCFIDDPKYQRIIDYAFKLGLIVVIHAGIDIGIEGEVKASPDRILRLNANLTNKGVFVLAHMGGWKMWNEVYEKLLGKGFYIDTAFSLGNTLRDGAKLNLMSKNDFKLFVKKQGADHILFGTDSPWALQSSYINFILDSGLEIEEVKKILGLNAKKLLNIGKN